MEHCDNDNLVLVRQRSGTGQRGRRRIETSTNRAIVVIAIASWQAVVQDMTRFLLDRSMPQPTEPNYGVARLIRGQVQGALNNFSTPNAENARQLLQSVGFDPARTGHGPTEHSVDARWHTSPLASNKVAGLAQGATCHITWR